MRLAWLAVGAGALLATAALAASGDALLVAGSNVNVRAGPSTEAGILIRVDRDAPAIERRRQGSWVEIDLPVQDVRGWIHESLLSAAPIEPAAGPEAGAPEVAPAAPAVSPATPPATPAATPAATPELIPDITHVAATDPALEPVAVAAAQHRGPLAAFRKEVEYFNNRAVAAAGVDLFTGIAPLGEGGVQVVTTDAWAIMSAPAHQSYLNTLFGSWQAAAGDGQALRLQIVDLNGVVMMEKSGP